MIEKSIGVGKMDLFLRTKLTLNSSEQYLTLGSKNEF